MGEARQELRATVYTRYFLEKSFPVTKFEVRELSFTRATCRPPLTNSSSTTILMLRHKIGL